MAWRSHSFLRWDTTDNGYAQPQDTSYAQDIRAGDTRRNQDTRGAPGDTHTIHSPISTAFTLSRFRFHTDVHACRCVSVHSVNWCPRPSTCRPRVILYYNCTIILHLHFHSGIASIDIIYTLQTTRASAVCGCVCVHALRARVCVTNATSSSSLHVRLAHDRS